MTEQAHMPPILYSTYIKASPERVYKALTEGDEWSQWFTKRATIDARVGGSYEFYWENFGPTLETFTLTGPVLEAEPNKTFAFNWGSGEDITTVRFRLQARGEGTVLHVTEDGYSMSDVDIKACLNCAAGWGEAITLLKFYVEHGVRYGDVPQP